MAAAHVQSTGVESVGSVASVAKAFASNVTAGNFIAVGCVSSTAAIPTNAVTDNLSNTYTQTAPAQDAGSGIRTAIHYAKNVTGGACTVTLDATGSDFQSIAISEFSG